MGTEGKVTVPEGTRRRTSDNVLRARRLLAGSAAGGHAGALVVVAVFWLLEGPASGISAALAAVVTLAFNMIGLGVQVLVADAPTKTVMIAALASYGLRVSVLGMVLMVVLSNADRFALLDPVAVVVATTVVVFTWLAAEFWTFSRLRIPAFDPPQD